MVDICKKEELRREIVEMVEGIENEDYIFKIYHYILAKYRREKCAEETGG